QVRCINAMLYQHRGLLEAATGAGKTLICGALCRKVKPFGKIVLIVDGKDLCFQTADELKKFGCDVGIVGCGLRDFGHDVSVCTWQTINSISKRSKGFQADYLTK
ncbi:MAG: DEAD/DEAH box helicase family protein, partial [Bacilli bacterium]|nr:DEAD/DEAH box helicase family protein [Bacilli bacterium]